MTTLDLSRSHVRVIELSDDRELEITQCDIGDVGCVVWDAALVLAYYLENWNNSCENHPLNLKRVVELGSGTGAVGLFTAALGAQCIITDLSDCLPLMQLNVSKNASLIDAAGGTVHAAELKWGSDCSDLLPHPDFILISDCVYYEESVKPLVRTIEDLAGPDTVVICCYEDRKSDVKQALQKSFFELLQLNFTSQYIDVQEMHPVYRSDDIFIVKLKRICAKI